MSLTPSSVEERTVVVHGFTDLEVDRLRKLVQNHADQNGDLAFGPTHNRHLKLALQNLVQLFHQEKGRAVEGAGSDYEGARIAGRENQRVIYLHGFDKKELFELVDLIKRNVTDPKGIAFATSTRNNLTMPLERLVWEVWRDHDYMQERSLAIKEGRPVPPPPED